MVTADSFIWNKWLWTVRFDGDRDNLQNIGFYYPHTQVITQEDFIAFRDHDTFKSYVCMTLHMQINIISH
jgi:hypothetical protein